MVGAEEFYDGLASEYHCLFPDWWSAALWHGSVIAALLAAEGVQPPASVLDCTCGIGTQALPLAATGYAVTATDVSAAAAERARTEAAERRLQVTLSVADVRHLRDTVQPAFDCAISCDNALPHLLTDADLDAALRSIRACLRDGGVFLASIRDYDALAVARPEGVPVTLHGEPGGRHASGQSWRWSDDGQHLDIALFTMRESAQGWRVAVHETTYRALQRDALSAGLARSGFGRIRWLMPEQSGYYQPVVLAVARGATG